MKAKPLPSIEKILEVLDYDPNTGVLTWKNHAGFKWKTAGNPTTHGYLKFQLDRQVCYCHRMIWKIETGKDPANQIDHIDGNKANNHISNLREATQFENKLNQPQQKNNKTGVKNICQEKGKYPTIQIVINGLRIRETGFKTMEEAVLRLDQIKKEHPSEFHKC
jgi:hypothetical protein